MKIDLLEGTSFSRMFLLVTQRIEIDEMTSQEGICV